MDGTANIHPLPVRSNPFIADASNDLWQTIDDDDDDDDDVELYPILATTATTRAFP